MLKTLFLPFPTDVAAKFSEVNVAPGKKLFIQAQIGKKEKGFLTSEQLEKLMITVLGPAPGHSVPPGLSAGKKRKLKVGKISGMIQRTQ